MAAVLADIVTAPVNGSVRTIALTASSAVTAIPSQWGTGDRYVTMISPVAFYYRFGSDNGEETDDAVDETSTDGTDDGVYVPADTFHSVFIPGRQWQDHDGDDVTHLILKGSGTGYLYTWLSSPDR